MQAAGILLIVLGTCIEITAFAAMASYQIRRRLPIQSPIPLQAADAGSSLLVASCFSHRASYFTEATKKNAEHPFGDSAFH